VTGKVKMEGTEATKLGRVFHWDITAIIKDYCKHKSWCKVKWL